jgi:hypothetical protein
MVRTLYLRFACLPLLLLASSTILMAQESKGAESGFRAIGPDSPVVEYLENPSHELPDELERVAVEVFFDRQPTRMCFSMPCYPSQVTENNIHYSNGWTETYDPKASSSCEILWDREARTARMWIESQTPARIVVRFRAAIADPDGYVGHSDIPSGSPYGRGDWTDEWYYIYPDATHTRHVRIYTGLAGQSLPVTDQLFNGEAPMREIPPMVVHEFHEMFVFGKNGHLPGDDIALDAVHLTKLSGETKRFSYKPYPKDFGDFTMAPIMLINLKSEYKPFTIFQPYGLENQLYPLEGEAPHVFQTWPSNPGDGGYSVSLGHALNWWHFRRTEMILEQVYLSGMTAEEDPTDYLVDLANSWIRFPRLFQKGKELTYIPSYYDPAQKAYILPKEGKGAEKVSFSLGFPGSFGDDNHPAVHIVNPVFIVEDWGNSPVKLKMNGRTLVRGKDFEAGYEKDGDRTRLVLWLDLQSDEEANFTLIPDS